MAEASDKYKLYTAFPIFFLNLLALYLLVKSSKLDYKIRILSINLCIADILTCVSLCFPTALYKNIFGSDLKDFFVLVPATAAFLTITLFNLDRFLAFKATLHYHGYVSKLKIKLSSLVVWILSLTLSFSQYCSIVDGYVCLAVPSSIKRNTIIVGYIRLVIFLLNAVFFGASIYHMKIKLLTMSDKYKCMSQTRTFLKVSAITGTFLVLFTPGMLWTIFKPNVTDLRVSMVTDIVCGFCFTASFIMDPIWYVLRFSDCRFQLRLLLHACNREKQEEIKSMRNKHYATYHISPNSADSSLPV
jgi:hypothetical protein